MHQRVNTGASERPAFEPATLDPARTALAVGMFSALAHFSWLAVVAAGVAQPLIDLVFRLHFIASPYHVGVFDTGTGLMLIAVSMIGGGAFGLVFALIWNALRPARR